MNMATAIHNVMKLSCVAALLASTSAFANQQATGTFQVTATVPMACWVDHSVQADALGNAPGLVTEGCNNASGYMVSAQYRPLAATESARSSKSRVIRPIRPLYSAIGMNSAGDTWPMVGQFQRASASKPTQRREATSMIG